MWLGLTLNSLRVICNRIQIALKYPKYPKQTYTDFSLKKMYLIILDDNILCLTTILRRDV